MRFYRSSVAVGSTPTEQKVTDEQYRKLKTTYEDPDKLITKLERNTSSCCAKVIFDNAIDLESGEVDTGLIREHLNGSEHRIASD